MITLSPDRPVLIAGPTASGKSALALQIAKRQGGVIVNADALQVFDSWRILTARPDATDLQAAPHQLYGHVPYDADYSVGHWLREITPVLQGPQRPIIVGGTGLNFHALTKGLAAIPAIPGAIRQRADQMSLAALLAELDPATQARLDSQNRMRVQRAWEVRQATGKTLAFWQDNTPPPLLQVADAICITLDAPKPWLEARIAARFDQMLAQGALAEARRMLPFWNPAHLSARAIGARELISYLQGKMTLEQARDAAIVASRQYAKRQRTWFRARHGQWRHIPADTPDLSATLDLMPHRPD